ncbi:MAG: hypothetical protein QW196_02405 [Sulfolobales archaeon]
MKLRKRQAENMAILIRDALLLSGWESGAMLALLHSLGVSRIIVHDRLRMDTDVWFKSGGLIKLPQGTLEMVSYAKARWLYRTLCSFFNHFCNEIGECYEWSYYCPEEYTAIRKHSRIINRVKSHVKLGSVPVSTEGLGYSPREVEVLVNIPVAFSYAGSDGTISTLGSSYKLVLERNSIPLSISVSIRTAGGRVYAQLYGYSYVPSNQSGAIEFRTFSVGEYEKAVSVADRIAGMLALEASKNIRSVENYLKNSAIEALKSLIDYGYMTVDEVVLEAARLQLLLVARAFTGAEACM